MQNLLILFNPYYEPHVIDKHIEILKEKGSVAFGKVKSKLNTHQPFNLASYSTVSPSNPLQLFLTDYSTLFVAKVTQITSKLHNVSAPSYYEQKGLEIEAWFIIEDMRELVHENFETTRDHYLSGFTTPAYGNHTYAIYGNQYQYPLVIEMKEEINYFPQDEDIYYPNIYKSEKFQKTKSNLIHYCFGEHSQRLHPNSFENLIFAEMEFDENRENKLYDFSGVAIKYGKAVEYEAYLLFRALFFSLAKIKKEILEIKFEVQGRAYTIADLQSFKPNLGTYKFLLSHPLITQTLEESKIQWISNKLANSLGIVQKFRNFSAHEGKISLEEIIDLREKILGIGPIQILPDFLNRRIYLQTNTLDPSLRHNLSCLADRISPQNSSNKTSSNSLKL